MYSLVIPVYKNEGSIEQLVANLGQLSASLDGPLEVVFVVDGSPDQSHQKLLQLLPTAPFRSNLVLLSRNFGSFQAVTAGMSLVKGDYLAVVAADLQEPPDLPLRFFEELRKGDCDLVLGQRITRDDPWGSRVMSGIFWGLYRRLVQRDLPPGGIDVFGCSRPVIDTLLGLHEANSSLVGLLLWVGFRRRIVGYARLPRLHGRSAWSFRRKLRYLKDSLFAFSDLPIVLLGVFGIGGVTLATVLMVAILIVKLTGHIQVPGYTAVMIAILFFGGLNAMGLSLLGEYIWRNFENSKQRPRFIIFRAQEFNSGGGGPATTGGDVRAT